mgnify:FL=1
MVTTISNAKLIENHHAVDGKTLHDELSIKIRKVFAEDLSDQEIENAVNQCSIGRKYIIEFPVSDIFEEEHQYDINNVIRMSPLFESVCRLKIFYKEKTKFARVWLKGDIRKFLSKGHKHHKS